MVFPQWALLSVALIFALPMLMASPLSAEVSELWGKDGDKWQPGGRLPDFSYAGYHRGEAAIPDVPVTANLKSFGALGDGQHDDTEAFRRAVKEAPAGAIEIPPGRYLVTDIVEIARSAEAEGADALSLVNTLLGMAIDVSTRRPKLARVVGGLSGPAIKPVALRMVWETCQTVKIPVIGVGGIASTEDALEFLIAGARAVQIGTANFYQPDISQRIALGLQEYCRSHHIEDINEIIGSLRAYE